MADILEEAYQEAKKVLKNCMHPLGMRSSAKIDGYYSVAGRDSMIALLGGSLIKDFTFEDCFKRTLKTLARYQTNLGCISDAVCAKTKKVSYKSTIDGTAWYVIGHYAFYKNYKDLNFLKRNYSNIQNALIWLWYQDVNSSGLVKIGEAGAWQDTFATRGNSLYANAVYFAALKAGEKIGIKKCRSLSEKTRKAINSCFWSSEKRIPRNPMVSNREEKGYWEKECKKTKFKNNAYLPYVSFIQAGNWFDSLGNLLAVVFNIADKDKSSRILNYISQQNINKPYPVKDIYPPIYPGQRDWRDYYKEGSINVPNHYQNGGIWPYIGGFYIAALVKAGRLKEAKENLIKLAEANRVGKRSWEFNEWLHGKSAKPLGKEEQAWSAGMYIYAYEALKRKNLIYF